MYQDVLYQLYYGKLNPENTLAPERSPEYNKALKKVLRYEGKLYQELDQRQKKWLEKLGIAYFTIATAEGEVAFREGMRLGFELYLSVRPQNQIGPK